MPLRDLNDSKHWRDRATEMRLLADDMKDAGADLANDYDELAARAAERARSGFDFSLPSPRSQIPKEKE